MGNIVGVKVSVFIEIEVRNLINAPILLDTHFGVKASFRSRTFKLSVSNYCPYHLVYFSSFFGMYFA